MVLESTFTNTLYICSVNSVAQLCLTLRVPMECNTPGFPVHHQLPEPTQTHVHCVGDAIQLSHPLSSPSPPAFNLSQYQGLFQWVSSLHQVAKVLEFFGVSASTSVFPMNIQDWFPLGWAAWISLQSNEFSRVFSNTTLQEHQFFGTQFFYSRIIFFIIFLIVVVLSYTDMNQPWIYMYSPSRSPLPPPSLPDPSRSSQCTRSEHLSHASNLGWWSVSP